MGFVTLNDGTVIHASQLPRLNQSGVFTYDSELLKQVAEKLKDRELFPDSNKRAKEFLEKVKKSDL